MRIIKLGLISFILIFLLITAMSLFIPSSIRISRATNIAPDKDRIWDLVSDTAKWKLWHPGFMEFGDADSTRKVSRTLRERTDSEISYMVQQGERKQVLNVWKIHGQLPADSLTLQWYMDFRLSWYPWQKFSSLFYESTYGAMMEEGLVRLKNPSK